MMMSSEKSGTLGYDLIFFERSYIVPHSCKVPYPGLNWFRIYEGGPFVPEAI